MKTNLLNFSILVSVAIMAGATINTASAQSNGNTSDTLSNLIYPIAELGNCKDKDDCKIYCNDSNNTTACVNYAEKKNLFSQNDLQAAKKFIATGAKGPGGC
jgi:hypothetical protein